jgi:hypothetical protein
MRRNTVTVHHFHPGPHMTAAVRPERLCETCGSPESASVHNVPERSDEERELADRIVGENR